MLACSIYLHPTTSFSGCSLSKYIPLQHGEVSLLSEYEMVQHLDSYDVPSLAESSGDIPILHTGFQVAAGVVVGHQDGCCPLSHCLNKDLHLCVTSGTIKLLLLGIENSYIM